MFTAKYIIYLLFTVLISASQAITPVCKPNEFFINYFNNLEYIDPINSYYILYDVNPVEGFNLRRDVYIRFAVFIKHLKQNKKFENTKLVLPPFRRLYHWKSNNIVQEDLLWRVFFNLDDMKNFTDIMDFDEFSNELASKEDTIYVDEVFQLLQFEEMFTNGVFLDKFEFTKCVRENHKPKNYHKFVNVVEKEVSCLKFQGSCQLLENVLAIASKKVKHHQKVFQFRNAEIVLHDHWGNKDFWQARRSMRFSTKLVDIANSFRMKYLNSTNLRDLVQRPENWQAEKNYRKAKGGPYICAHLRRGDFVEGREKTTPTLRSAANQIKKKLLDLNLTTVFIATDGDKFEYKNLKAHIGQAFEVYRFIPDSIEMKNEIKDGGIAIVDQIICSHSRYFIGTYESTFTYRIYEEREILGFTKDTTFNTFCRYSDHSECPKNSIWPIVY